MPLLFVTGAQAGTQGHTLRLHPAWVWADRFQEGTITSALRDEPSGTQISASQVEWDHGNVIMTVPASADSGTGGCPANWSCVYDGHFYEGTRLQFRDENRGEDLHRYGGSHWLSLSYSNTRAGRAWLLPESHFGGSHQYCMSPHSAAGVIPSPYPSDEWIYLVSTSRRC
jgi:hypothetical protein